MFRNWKIPLFKKCLSFLCFFPLAFFSFLRCLLCLFFVFFFLFFFFSSDDEDAEEEDEDDDVSEEVDAESDISESDSASIVALLFFLSIAEEKA